MAGLSCLGMQTLIAIEHQHFAEGGPYNSNNNANSLIVMITVTIAAIVMSHNSQLLLTRMATAEINRHLL